MTVLIFIKPLELPRYPDIVISLRQQGAINRPLTQKLVEPVIRIVITYKKSLFNIMCDRRKAVDRSAVLIGSPLSWVTTIKLNRGVLINSRDF